MPNYVYNTTGMFRGKPIPAAQPQLMTGGIMRSYQVEGMDWIKVGHCYHDNHVCVAVVKCVSMATRCSTRTG